MKITMPLPKYVVPALLLLVFPSCHPDDSQVNLLQDELRNLGDQQGQAQSELNRMKLQIETLSKERDAIKADKSRLDADLQSLRKSLDQMQKDYALYRSQYKLSMRAKAPGLPLGDFVVDGKPYKNVKAREATENFLAVLHDSGTQKFPWKSLPDPIRTLFGQEMPGEYPMIDFAAVGSAPKPASTEDLIARHDSRKLGLQKQMQENETRLADLKKAEAENRGALSEAKYKKLDTLNLERAQRAYEVQRIQLNAEHSMLKKSWEILMREDPSKKKK